MKSETVRCNGIALYCEVYGAGAPLVIVPDGNNDCEPFRAAAELLADEFCVVVPDMRGSVRSPDPEERQVTPALLAEDIAGLIRHFDMGPASVWGCSSGGQAVLALCKRQGELVKNAMVHEAALMRDLPLPGGMRDYMEHLSTFDRHCEEGFTSNEVCFVGDHDAWMSLSEACRERLFRNRPYWAEHYVSTVDQDTYTAEDFARMPPVDFSVGAWSPAFLVCANLRVAARGGRPVTWLACSHHPEITSPEILAAYIRSRCKSCGG